MLGPWGTSSGLAPSMAIHQLHASTDNHVGNLLKYARHRMKDLHKLRGLPTHALLLLSSTTPRSPGWHPRSARLDPSLILRSIAVTSEVARAPGAAPGWQQCWLSQPAPAPVSKL